MAESTPSAGGGRAAPVSAVKAAAFASPDCAQGQTPASVAPKRKAGGIEEEEEQMEIGEEEEE